VACPDAIKADKLTQLRQAKPKELEPSNTHFGRLWPGRRQPTVPVGG